MTFPSCGCGSPYTGVTVYEYCGSNAYCDEYKCKARKAAGQSCVLGKLFF